MSACLSPTSRRADFLGCECPTFLELGWNWTLSAWMGGGLQSYPVGMTTGHTSKEIDPPPADRERDETLQERLTSFDHV